MKERKILKEFNKDNLKLSPQQDRLLYYIACGFTSKRIAEEMRLSKRTVESYRQKLMDKLGAKNGFEMVAIAVNRQWIKLSGSFDNSIFKSLSLPHYRASQ